MTLLHVVSIAALILGAASAIAIAVDEARRPQMMAIMNVVWPTVALFGGLLVLRA
jgi:ABC-type proline/glycine betaine transport system permease subunit